MTYARREIVEINEVATYHCVSRCVRRAFLCGKDPFSAKCYEHRRRWIRKRLIAWVAVFAIEVIAYAVMSNHLHSLIKTRPDLAKDWTDEEVARRWRLLFPFRRRHGKAAEPSRGEIQAITADPEKVALYRERLCSISWFNRCLNEHIARLANVEDACKGRFWEGRFQCQRVFDIAGIIACGAYIDLNPIRAGVAKTLEGSDHTSIQDRIYEHTKKARPAAKRWEKVPLLSIEEATEGKLTVEEYFEIVDEAGRQIKAGKGSISSKVAPILERLKIRPERWVEATESFSKKFRRVVGPAEYFEKAAARAKKRCFHGIQYARVLFQGVLSKAVA